jgi:DNA-binding beta-propeller fold protein YncE
MRSAARLASFLTASSVALAAGFSAAAGALLLSACGSCDSIVHQTAVPAMAGANIDAVEADQGGHRLYFADRTNHGVDIVDTSGATPRFKGTINLPDSPNGLAFSPGLKRLYAGMDGGQLAVIDMDARSPQYTQVIDKVTVDTTNADLLDFSPRTHSVYVGTSQSGTVVVVDASTDTVTNRFDVKGPVEQPRLDPADGRLYVTTPKTDALLQLDPATGAVTRTFTQKGCRPTGLAINPSRQIALVACGASTAVFDLRTGLDQVSATVQGGDIVNYDSHVNSFTIGSSHGPSNSTIGVFAGDGHFVGQVASAPNAHGAVFDDASGLLYAASARGLLSFAPAACAPLPGWVTPAATSAVFFAPLLAFGLFLLYYARRPTRPVANKQTWEQLQQEDFASERERMRALEDVIYGPLDG